MMRRPYIPILLVTLAVSSSLALAQTTGPALTQISREMKSLYEDLQTHMVRVQIPVPTTQAVAQSEHPMSKWAPQYEQLRRRVEAGDSIRIFIDQNPPSTQATTQGTATTQPAMTLRIEQLADQSKMIPVNPTAIECVGLILDNEGRILMPAYVDGEWLGDRPLNVVLGPQQSMPARFIGSDRQTSTTVIQLQKPAGKAIELSETKPEIGSMVLMIYPSRGNVRMEVWTGGREEYAVVVGMDGRMGGIVQRGHLLSPTALKPVLAQLCDTGKVERAKVGIRILEVPLETSLAANTSTGMRRTAVRVEEVRKDSPAHLAGIQVGDLILSMAGEPVEDLPNFAAAITTCRGKTELRVLRNGAELKASIDLQPN
jgi:hypothetical protein